MNKISLHKITTVVLAGLLVVISSCDKHGSSLYDPNYESSRPTPVISEILPVGGYLAGVDSLIIKGENFATVLDSMTINFGGVPGTIKRSTPTEMVVRPGFKVGDDVAVRISVRGSEFFSNTFPYKLDDPFNYYKGTNEDYRPASAIAIDDNDNIYALVNNKATGYYRYTKISPDGTITLDDVKGPGEKRPAVGDNRPYPRDSTMRFNNYSTLLYAGNDQLLMAQQGLRAIFQKTFGDGLQESVWKASSSSALKIKGALIDDKGYVWVVGLGSNQIHRFDLTTKTETKFPFNGDFTALALYEDKLFVGGNIDGNVEIWSFSIDTGGNLGVAEKYFDFQSNYDGVINDMIFASNGDLIIATSAEESLVRVFPNGTHQQYYDGVTKKGAFTLTWRKDRFMVVGVQGDGASINYLDTFDKNRAGIYY